MPKTRENMHYAFTSNALRKYSQCQALYQEANTVINKRLKSKARKEVITTLRRIISSQQYRSKDLESMVKDRYNVDRDQIQQMLNILDRNSYVRNNETEIVQYVYPLIDFKW